jgi:hypothetical protein
MPTLSLQRRTVMRDIVRTAQETGDTVAPWRAMGDLDGRFVDETDVLLEVHREWVRVLVGRLHRREVVAERTPVRVRDLYDEVATDHPTLRGGSRPPRSTRCWPGSQGSPRQVRTPRPRPASAALWSRSASRPSAPPSTRHS